MSNTTIPQISPGQELPRRVAIVVPAYRVKRHILDVLDGIPAWVDAVYVVDDACPDGSGRVVKESCSDPRVSVIFKEENSGVGGAVMTGYQCAAADSHDIIVKMDGDGQMDPEMLSRLVAPLLSGEADYSKGNRFYDLTAIGKMPRIRILGNAALSFMSKLSTGYWDVFDPTNGYTAIHSRLIQALPLDKISRRYFFETDLLFRLGTIRAVVCDVPMPARYGDEESGLKISRILADFLYKHSRNCIKRIFYNYFLRDVSLASFELLLGIAAIIFGVVTGLYVWIGSAGTGVMASAGTVMVSALPVILGVQLLLGFIAFDIAAVPRRPIWRLLR